MASRQTLVIRHLPPELSDAEKEDLLRHFGATSVKIVASKKKKSIAFAKFDTDAKARNVLFRLHQLEVLGIRLTVEYAKENITIADPRIDKNTVLKEDEREQFFREFKHELNAWNTSVNFHQPPPPHLKYAYPRANVATINNIAHALASVPKFYTQVLHLMNKMNLPPPFSNIPDPPEVQIQHHPPVDGGATSEEKIIVETSESELESDPDDTVPEENIPPKRTLPQSKRKVKRPKFIKPAPATGNVTHKQNTNEVFDTVDLELSQKKIEMKVSTDCMENIGQGRGDAEEVGTIGKMDRVKEDVATVGSVADNAATEDTNCITDRELAANRISENDFDHLPVFKNYHAGAPSCRLYIKNLSKNVSVDDVKFIYKRFLEPDQVEENNMFDVRLMQEGRMKGQAFVTLPTVAQAQKALKQSNGYILKEKPIVVVFARSAKPKL